MKKVFTSYFILFLYIVFSVGIIIEEHNHCSTCDSGECSIEIPVSEHHEHNSCENNTHHHENGCNCSFDEYKIKADYISEEKIKPTSANMFFISFINTFINNTILQPIVNAHIGYLKIPDKQLFYKQTLIQLSSILC